ncbi:hypothetical protein NPIL_240241 [Nephila pilipes]|uniref:Uncharacterized protein n=1 Tax=Nephila pilipes TaxID=299642 RepID=A0A8X6IJW8_NEPPI|nr:hypothetical protein NPIL_240241 [Nephila pilipes]
MPTRFDTPSNRANFNGCTMPPAWGYQHQPQFLKWRTWAQPARPAHSLKNILEAYNLGKLKEKCCIQRGKVLKFYHPKTIPRHF